MPSFRASVEEHAKNVRACAGEEARRGRFDKAEAQELAESQRGLAPRRVVGGRTPFTNWPWSDCGRSPTEKPSLTSLIVVWTRSSSSGEDERTPPVQMVRRRPVWMAPRTASSGVRTDFAVLTNATAKARLRTRPDH